MLWYFHLHFPKKFKIKTKNLYYFIIKKNLEN